MMMVFAGEGASRYWHSCDISKLGPSDAHDRTVDTQNLAAEAPPANPPEHAPRRSTPSLLQVLAKGDVFISCQKSFANMIVGTSPAQKILKTHRLDRKLFFSSCLRGSAALFRRSQSTYKKFRFQFLMLLDKNPALRTRVMQEFENLNLCCMDDFTRRVWKKCNNGKELHHLMSPGFLGALDGWAHDPPVVSILLVELLHSSMRSAIRSKSGPASFRAAAIEEFLKRCLHFVPRMAKKISLHLDSRGFLQRFKLRSKKKWQMEADSVEVQRSPPIGAGQKPFAEKKDWR